MYSTSSCLSFSMSLGLCIGQIDFCFGCNLWFTNGWIVNNVVGEWMNWGEEWLYVKAGKILYMQVYLRRRIGGKKEAESSKENEFLNVATPNRGPGPRRGWCG